jgi:hypothetical protein
MSNILNNPARLHLLQLLQSGKALTVIEATNLVNTPDPRSHIRYLRNEGYPIRDRWIQTGYRSRSKLYFMLMKDTLIKERRYTDEEIDFPQP